MNPRNDELETRVCKTYVWHEDKCFFVSTIERDCSAMAYPHRYNETLVWIFDWKTNTKGRQVAQGEAGAGSIRTHQRIVQELFDKGEVSE